MYERGEYEDARSFAEHARRIWQSIDLDGPNVDRHDLLDLRSQVAYSLGTIAQITHQKRESLQMNTEMLVLRKTLKLENGNGPGDPLLAHAYNELGSDFMADDEYEIAEGFYKRSIMVYESVGHDFKKDWLILPSVNLGLAYWLQGRYRDAEEIVLNTLLEQEMMLGADDGITMKYVTHCGLKSFGANLYSEPVGCCMQWVTLLSASARRTKASITTRELSNNSRKRLGHITMPAVTLCTDWLITTPNVEIMRLPCK